MRRSLLAVIAGYLIRSTLIMITQNLLGVPPWTTAGAGLLLVFLGSSFIYSGVAGFITALIAPHSELKHGMVLSGLIFVSGIIAFFFLSIGEVLWLQPSLTFLSILGVIGGSYLGRSQKGYLSQKFSSNPILIVGLSFAGAGLIFIFVGVYVAGTSTLTCRRVESTQVNCNLTKKGWLGQVTVRETLLTHVQGARLETYTCSSEDSKGRTVSKQCQKLVIETTSGDVSTDLPISSQVTINDFIQSSPPTLVIERNDWGALLMACFGGLALVLGIFLIRFLSKAGGGEAPIPFSKLRAKQRLR